LNEWVHIPENAEQGSACIERSEKCPDYRDKRGFLTPPDDHLPNILPITNPQASAMTSGGTNEAPLGSCWFTTMMLFIRRCLVWELNNSEFLYQDSIESPGINLYNLSQKLTKRDCRTTPAERIKNGS